MAHEAAFVTGGTGFIGRALVASLVEHGWRVKVLVRPSSVVPKEWLRKVELVSGDVRDSSVCAAGATDSGCVFHFAASVHDFADAADDSEQESTTLGGTRVLLAAALAARVDRFIFTSSLGVYGESQEVRDERDECRPTTAYGRAKLSAEQIVAAIPQERLRWTILRPAMVYGVGAPGNLSLMARLIRAHVLPPLPYTTGRRSLVSVTDVVQAALLAANADRSPGCTFNLTDDQPMSMREIQNAIRLALGRQPHRWSVPVPAIQAAARIADLLSLLSGKKGRSVSHWTERMLAPAEFSSEKIERELGFRPETSLTRELPAILAAHRLRGAAHQ